MMFDVDDAIVMDLAFNDVMFSACNMLHIAIYILFFS